MDLSKLPNRSTPAAPPSGQAPVEAAIAHALPPEPKATPVAAPAEHSRAARAGAIGNAWISLVLGVLFAWLGLRFAKWLIAVLAGQRFDTGITWNSNGPRSGAVDYWELQGYVAMTEMAMFAMGVALLLDALILFFAMRRQGDGRWLVLCGACLTGLALLINLGVSGYLFSVGVTPLFSIIAVLVGGFMLMDHLAMYHDRRQTV